MASVGLDSSFTSVKEYTLNYGHNGEHIKLIRTRFDINNKKNYQILSNKIKSY